MVTPQVMKTKKTCAIVSAVAYLIGVRRSIFENEKEPFELDVFRSLEANKHARIIRHLCILRTDFEQHYKKINDSMRNQFRVLTSLNDEISQQSITVLTNDGIPVIKSFRTPNEYIIHFNRLITDRINNCRTLFPPWINWTYLREIFIMPNGLTDKGLKEAAAEYYAKKSFYPYQAYMNWPASEKGNILYTDEKFLTLLYEWHQDIFDELSKVTDADDKTKDSIYAFLENSKKTLMMVDCENADPYKLCSVLLGLQNSRLVNIAKVILYDDVNSSVAWQSFEQFSPVPVERLLVERVKKNKSLVDPVLIGGAYREFYKNEVDSFILVSSDSDYWGLISSLPEARWLLMIESDKCGPDLKRALYDANIFFCYMDDFYPEIANDFSTFVILSSLRQGLSDSFKLNLKNMLERIYMNARISLTDKEKERFYKKCAEKLELELAPNGDIRISLKMR